MSFLEEGSWRIQIMLCGVVEGHLQLFVMRVCQCVPAEEISINLIPETLRVLSKL